MNKMLNNEQSLAYADNRDGYGQSINPTAAPQINNIEALESQIAMVKERIARNKRALVDMKGVTDRVGNLEFKKINSTDPSSIWRWKEQQKDMREANANIKADEQVRFGNKVDMLVNKRPATTAAVIDQQIDELESAIVDGKNIGADVSPLYEKIAQLRGEIGGNKDTRQEVIDADVQGITSGKSNYNSKEIKKFIEDNRVNLTREQVIALEAKMNEVQAVEAAAEAKKGYDAGFKEYLKSLGKDYYNLSKKMISIYKRAYDKYLARGGKK